MDMIADNWEWILLGASGLSLITLLATVLALPWVLLRLPRDYFTHDQRSPLHTTSPRYSMAGLALGAVRNTLGLLLVVLGLIMLVTPGQGLLTLMAGLMLMNFPGKYHLERALARSPGVLRGINWVRRRAGAPPMDSPEAKAH